LTFTETKAITREALYPNGNAINNQTGDSSFSVDSIERKIKDKISSIRDLF
jgi:hypothetical protein